MSAALNLVTAVVLISVFATLIHPRVRNNQAWSAIVTPLASIIGSGFLVSVPLLASSIGVGAIPAVVGLTGVAFLLGATIRYNIRVGEPIFETAEAGHSIHSVELLSHLVLTGAYFISVAYYLVLLAAFGMQLLGLHNPMIAKLVPTALILGICAIGATKGLEGVERAEKYTVSANLAAIAALLTALVVFGLALPAPYTWGAATAEHHTFDGHTLRFLMGLVIIVQGFETTRFMGSQYDAPTRIQAMRRAQLLSSAIYLIFFILMVPLFPYFTSAADVAGFIKVIHRVSPWLPFIVTGGAIASQLSASVADSIGASGLIATTTHGHVNEKHGYLLIGAVSVIVIWTTDVVSIVALASRAFALFYALQALVATQLARHRGETGRAAGFGALAAASLAIAVFGIPAG